MEILEHLLGVCGESHLNLVHVSVIAFGTLCVAKVVWSAVRAR